MKDANINLTADSSVSFCKVSAILKNQMPNTNTKIVVLETILNYLLYQTLAI